MYVKDVTLGYLEKLCAVDIVLLCGTEDPEAMFRIHLIIWPPWFKYFSPINNNNNTGYLYSAVHRSITARTIYKQKEKR